MNDTQLFKLSRKCFYVCVGASLLFLIVWFVLQALEIPLTGLSPRPCVWYNVFQVYCPGCGGTRAVESLMHGEFVKSFLYHPAVLYTVILVVIYMLSHTLHILTKGKVKVMLFKAWYLYSIIVVIMLQCLIKNAFVLWGNGYPYA